MITMATMEARYSCRSFDGVPLTAGEAAELSAMLEAVSEEATPFGHRVRLRLHAFEAGRVSESDGKAGRSGEGATAGRGGRPAAGAPVRLGTYGLVSGASAFIVPACPKGPGAMEDLGYVLEKAVLEATAMGWDSCWIGGVFSRGKAADIVGVSGEEIVPAVIALGRAAARRTLADRMMGRAARSRSRKPFEELVFDAASEGGGGEGLALRGFSEEDAASEGGGGEGLALRGFSEEDAASGARGAGALGRWLEAARALQGAPSASNKQPWRLLRDAARAGWLVCLDEDRIYNNSLGPVHLQNIDIGIGMRHFAEAARILGLEGRWRPLSAAGAETETGPKNDGVSGAAVPSTTTLRYAQEQGWQPLAFWS